MQKKRITSSEPDEYGHWGQFGGRYVPETLVAPLEELTSEFMHARSDANFWRELNALLRDYCGRPTPLFHAQRLTGQAGGAQIYLKREDLLHTGAHKINNAVGQALLARRMDKRRIIAETGAGQHGVATATVASLFGMECTVIEGETSDTVEFTRAGVNGRLIVAADHFDLDAKLGFLLGAFARTIESEIERRLTGLHEGFEAMRRDGYPVENIAPQAAIYLSVQMRLNGRRAGTRKLVTNEDIRAWLLETAHVALVPFQAFGSAEEDGWFRLSVGAVSVREIGEMLPRLRKALEDLRRV